MHIDESKRKWWILAAMGGVLGVAMLDETVVGVALPTIRHDLGMSQVTSHWVVNAYMLVFTGFVAAGGRFGDIFGHRGFCVLGLAIFGLASLACGFAQDSASLITARAIQGLGAAIIFPASIAMITIVFPPEQRGLAFGINTTIAGVFMSLGPLVGGFFTEVLSWRWIFWVNLPFVAAIALVVLATWVQPKRDSVPKQATQSIDYRGLVTLVVGLSALVTALMQGVEWGWSAPSTLTLLAVGAIVLMLFTGIESRATEPMVDIGLFRNATFTGSNLVAFILQFNKITVIVFVALFLQDVVHKSPIVAGSALLVGVAPSLVTSTFAGRLTDRYGARWPSLAGLLINGSAMLWIGLVVFEKTYGSLILPLALWGATLPFLAVPPRRAAMASVPTEEQGQAGGIILTTQLFGGTIAMALCGTVLVMTASYEAVFILAAALAFAAFLVAWFTIERQPGAPVADSLD